MPIADGVRGIFDETPAQRRSFNRAGGLLERGKLMPLKNGER